MWLSKIFYGILYRESLLRADRKQGKRTIIPKALLQELRLHHDFMQGIRRSLEFPAGIPGSIFIYGTSVPDRTELQFDFLDNHANRSIALRMGSVGLICCFQDGGMTKGFHDHLNRTYYRDTPLHPVQFREATAEVFYKSMLLDSTAFYVIAETPGKMQIATQLPAGVNFKIGTGSYIAVFLVTTGASRWKSFMAEILGELHLSAEKMASPSNLTRTRNIASSSLTNGKRYRAADTAADPVIVKRYV